MLEFSGKDTNDGQPGGKSNIAVFLLLLFVVVGIAFFVYLKNQSGDLSSINIKELLNSRFWSNREASSVQKDTFRIEYDPKEHPVFKTYKNWIIKCSKDNVMCLDKDGEVQWTKTVPVNNPLVKAGGSNLLVAELGGRNFYVINGKEIKWTQKVDGNIINADINEKGYISIVREMKGYNGAIEVYDPQGNWIFTSSRGECFVISARVLPSCKEVIVNTLKTSGINSDTSFEYVDMKGKLLGNVEKEDAIYPSVWTVKGDTVIAVSNSKVIGIDEERKEKWEYEFEGAYSSNVLNGKSTVLAVMGKGGTGLFNGSKTDVRILNSDGQVTADFAVDGAVLNIETHGSIIAVNTGREVLFADSKGKIISKYRSVSDIIETHFFSKSEAAIITRNSVIVYKID